MTNPVSHLVDILNLDQLELNLFRGSTPPIMKKRVFGGQTIAQALVAAQRTVDEDRPIHSMHSYFLSQARAGEPMFYEVERLRDGGSFSVRRVVARQGADLIYSLEASFHVKEPGLDFHEALPAGLAEPENIAPRHELAARMTDPRSAGLRHFLSLPMPCDIRVVLPEHYLTREPLAPLQYFWMRPLGTFPSDRTLQHALLGYIADMGLLDVALYPHARQLFDADLMSASLDHSMWFHRAFDINDWLLYKQESNNTCGARGLCSGSFYTRDGTLVATVAQEALLRVVKN